MRRATARGRKRGKGSGRERRRGSRHRPRRDARDLRLGALLGFGGRFVAVAPGTESVSVTAEDLVRGGKAYLGSYSSTMADLARVIALAEAGRLGPVVTRRAPLEDAAEVLGDLRAGKIVGRAVLFPGPMNP
ncbi:MAG: zinc-binding dehydrogenase [Methanobacteriota archaeon]|nr:MAG: zinc-binding dehydrogenase [Euryarchaeota archaeon]